MGKAVISFRMVMSFFLGRASQGERTTGARDALHAQGGMRCEWSFPSPLHSVLTISVVTLPQYCAPVHALAASAAVHASVPCVLVSVSSQAACAAGERVALYRDEQWSSWTPAPTCALLHKCEWPCAYRQVWVLKMHLLLKVVAAELDALVIDADWRFIGDPSQLLHSLLHHAVVALVDRPVRRGLPHAGNQLINVGLMLVRST